MMQAAILQAIAGLTRLAAALEPEKLLPQVVDLVRESLDLSHVRVYLLAGDALAAPGAAAGEKYDGTLFLAAAAGAAGPQLPAWGQRLSLSQVPSSVGRAVQSRAEVVCEDGPDALLPDARAEMALPLLVAGELLGVLDLLAVEPNRFSPEDMPLWTTLAEQAAVAVQQAHLLAELTRLYEISTALHTAVNLAEIAQALALPAGEAGVSSTTLFKFELDSAGQPEWMEAVATWVGAGTPATPVGARLYLPDFSLARLWSASPAMPLFISDVANDPRLDAAATSAFWPTGTGAAAILPLALKERWVGLAVINWAAPRLVTAGDRRLYHSLAGQAAVMVDNRLLFEQTQKRAGQLEKLAEIEAALSGAGHEAEILSALAPIVTSGRDKARLSLNYLELNGAGQPITLYEAAGWRGGAVVTDDQAYRQPVPLAAQPAASLWLNAPNSVLFIEDLLTDPRINENGWTSATQQDIRAMAVMPLQSGGRWQGAVMLTWAEPRVFTADERFLLRRLLEPLAAVVASRRAYLAQKRLSTVVEATSDFVGIIDPQGKTVYLNQAGRKMMGFGPEEDLSNVHVSQYHPDWVNKLIADEGIPTAMRDGLWTGETVVLSRAGQEIPVSQVIIAQKDTNGNLDFIVGVMRDITELKQAEEKMAGLYAQVQSALQETQQSQLLLRSIIDATPDWIFIKDQEHRYRLANQGYAKALHLSPDDFIGKNDLELGFPEELVKGNPDKGIRGFWTDDRQVLDSGEPLVNPSDPATIDGQVHIFHTIKTPLRDADGHIWGVLAFARDTTEREQLLTETGAQAQRMALLNELGAQLSQTSSVDEVFKVANLKTNQIMKADRASIALLNPAGDTFKVLALDGIKGAVPVGAQMPVEGTAVGLAIREKRMIVLGNLETSQFLDTRRLGEQGVRSTMNAPLVVGGQTIGTLNVASKWPDAYSSADENLLLQIASLLSSAIESRRLLEAAQQRAEQEHLVRTITEKVRRGASREAILQTTLQELSRTLGASKAFVRLGSQARLISQGDTTTSNQETLPDQIKGVSR